MKKEKKYIEYILKQAEALLAIDSPSGFTEKVTDYLCEEYKRLGYKPVKTKKGGVLVEIGGKEINGNFRLVSFEETADGSMLHNEGRQFEVTLCDDEAKLTVTVITRLDGSDFIERRLRIRNDADCSIPVTGVSPLA